MTPSIHTQAAPTGCTQSDPHCIVVDATACTSGGKVYVEELLPRMINSLPNTEWVVYGDDFSAFAKVAAYDRVQFRSTHFPSPVKSLAVAGIAKWAWREFVLPLDVLRLRPCLLFSTSNFCSSLFSSMSVPVVLAVHNLLPFHQPDWYRERSPIRRARQRALKRLTIRSVRRADKVIAFSSYAKSIFAPLTADSSISIVHHGICPGTRRWHGWDSDTVLLVSHYFSYKNIDVVIRAWPHVQAATGQPFKLLVQGMPYDDRYYEDLLELVRSLRLENSVTLGRGLPSAELAVALSNSRCLVFPPIGENCPITLLEAMSIGAPIVASNAPPHAEICGDAAVYYETFNELNCAAAITRLLTEPHKGRELSTAGRRLASEVFTWDTCAQKTLDVIRQAWNR
jgi:glycosyltransferase involved in cell wall biosynthesis